MRRGVQGLTCGTHRTFSASLQREKLFAMYIPGVLVVSKRNKPRMPQVIIGRPFRELELATSTGRNHRHSFILVAVKPWPQRPAPVSGRFANEQALISNPRKRRNSCSRSDGVNPFRLRAAYISLLPS